MLIYSSLQIDLPESVTNRVGHSLSTFYVSKRYIWIVVIGGTRDDDVLVTDPDITMIVELGVTIILLY